jgi:DNA-binding transcriptional MerR regulator
LSESSPAAAADQAYGLEQLLALAGERLGEEINARTVRLYATQGLIDRPGKEGRNAVYGRRQLLQLLLIRTLARRGLSLSAIAPLVALADEELEQQFAQIADTVSGAASGDASGDAAGTASSGNAALAYLQGLQPSAAGSSQSLLPLLGDSLASLAAPGTAKGGSVSGGSVPGGTSRMATGRLSASRQAASRWHRFFLAPGVELHLSEAASIPPAGPRRQAWLQRLLERLREQLDSTD